MQGSPKSGNIKIGLLVVAFLLALSTLWYTQTIVKKLQAKEHDVAALYAQSLQYIANERIAPGDYSFVFDEIIRAIDFPLILTDAHYNPLPPYSQNIRNIRIDTTQSLHQQEKFLRRLIAEMDEKNPAIKVAYQDTLVLNYVHYGESVLVRELRWLPYIEIAIASLFILIGYIGFSYIKRSEQSNIWVGMAKETAHQLGTPLSSMMGWIEILKMNSNGNQKLLGTITEMQSDLERLNKVAARFSKIGSKPDLREENLNEVIQNVICYFEKRIPQTGKNIQISIEPKDECQAMINRELFEWVIENLIKNGLDAIEDKEGKILFTLSKKGNMTYIDVTDTGKGIDLKYKKDIFRPGFSSKKRGWGLGLSLSKRIIETYHKGRLMVKESKIGKGTTFRIKLVK